MNKKEFVLEHDIIIEKGTKFMCQDGESVKYITGNYMSIIDLGKDSVGIFSVTEDSVYANGDKIIKLNK